MMNETPKKYLSVNIFIEAILGSIATLGFINISYSISSIIVDILINIISFLVIYYLLNFHSNKVKVKNAENQKNIDTLNINIEKNFEKLNTNIINNLKSIEENINKNTDRNITELNSLISDFSSNVNKNVDRNIMELNSLISNFLDNVNKNADRNIIELKYVINNFSNNTLKEFKGLREEIIKNNDKLIDQDIKLQELCDNLSEENENIKDLINFIEDIKNLCYESNMSFKNQNTAMEQKLSQIIKGNKNIADNYAQIQTSFSNELIKLIDKSQDIAKVLEVTVKTLKNIIEKI